MYFGIFYWTWTWSWSCLEFQVGFLTWFHSARSVLCAVFFCCALLSCLARPSQVWVLFCAFLIRPPQPIPHALYDVSYPLDPIPFLLCRLPLFISLPPCPLLGLLHNCRSPSHILTFPSNTSPITTITRVKQRHPIFPSRPYLCQSVDPILIYSCTAFQASPLAIPKANRKGPLTSYVDKDKRVWIHEWTLILISSNISASQRLVHAASGS